MAEGSLTAVTEPGPGGPVVTAADHLLARLALLEGAVAAAVEARQSQAGSGDPAGSGGQGLFISDADVGRLLAARPAWLEGPASRVPVPIGHADAGEDRCSLLARVFELGPLDVAVLVAALAPDVDARFERLYAYLVDDVTSRRPTIGLCLELCGLPVADPEARARFRPDGPLVRNRLLYVDATEAPFPNRTVRVPDRVVDHLLGVDRPDEAVVPLLLPPLAVDSPHAEVVRTALGRGVDLFYQRAPGGAADHARAAGALVSMGLPVLAVDLDGLGAQADPVETAAVVAREAGLLQAGLVAGPVDALAARDVRAVDALAASPGPVVLLGAQGWDPRWTGQPAVVLEEAGAEVVATTDVWRSVVGEDTWTPALDEAAATFRLGPHQVLRAVRTAQAHAAARGTALDADAVRAGARGQNGGRLESLARLVHPRATADDLVLAEPAAGQVAEVSLRARMRHRVVGEWRMRGLGVRGTGVTALFAGPSGTGKTLAAEVIAGSLGLDLYVVDLSSVVDKYVGETEKNLEAVFSGAQGVNGVLFFDEADALFGKRSAVSDGHDRYANIEVAYLLQRMEQFDGVSLLATNLVANLDDAFARRIDVRVVFPQPEAPERRRLWSRHLPSTLPVAADVDVDVLATAFRLAGGDIANVTLAAAYEAAGCDQAVGMAHLVRAVAREYRKLGRMCTKEDFGPWFDAIGPPPG